MSWEHPLLSKGPLQNNQMKSDADASPLSALLFLDIPPVCLVIAPCQQGASTPFVRSGYFSAGPKVPD